MKKSWINGHEIPIHVINKVFLIMRMTFLLVVLLNASVFAERAYAQQSRVTLQVENMSLEEVIVELRQQTGVRFCYSMDKLKMAGKVSVDVQDQKLSDVLDQVLAGTGLTYDVLDNVVTISPRGEVAAPQQKSVTITGKVMNAQKQPLPGVTVQLKGGYLGTATDIDGTYKLTVPLVEKMAFLFSFIGMKVVDVPYNGNNTINVTMVDDVKELDGVVVTGYNNIKSSSFTGNAVTVKQEDLLKVSKTNVIRALQSFDPSFRIRENNQWGSDPNALPEVYIRGESGIGVKSLDKDALAKSNLKDNPNLPTFIMDGFEVSVSKLYDMDPNRIESITILKDAAATALYGSRAANGVVVITTVAPKPGKLNVDYNFVGDVTFPDLTDYDLLNAEEKLEVERLAGYYVPWDKYTDQYTLDKEYNGKLANISRGVNTYWLAKPLQTVFNHKHSLYVDGGSDNLRFGIELQYANQDGVMKGSLRDRIGAGFYLQYSYKSFTVKNLTTYQKVTSHESPYGNFADYARQLPYDEYQDRDGRYYEMLYYWGTGSDMNKVNPLYEPSLHNFDKTGSEEFINNLSLNWNIINGLLLKGQLSLTKTMDKQQRFYDPLSKQKANINQLSLSNLNSGTLYMNHTDGFIMDMNATLSFNRMLGNHMINALAGISIKEDQSRGDNSIYLGFASGAMSSPEFAKEVYQKPGFSESTNRLVGFLMSANYSYKDIYLLDASVRVDGSSVFGTEKRYAPFWSFGVGLNIHKYGFMQEVDFIDQLKIRGSYGQTGKANFPSYAARTTYEIPIDRWYKTGLSAKLKALGNKNLTWETTNSFDVGGEITLFHNLLYLKGSYYNKRTIDLINDVTVPTSTGFMSYRDNIGEVSNKGFELDLRVAAIQKPDFSLIFNANMAHNRNRIEKISESLKAYNQQVIDQFEKSYNTDDPDRMIQAQPFLQYEEGGSLSSIFGVRSMGINPADGQEVFIDRKGNRTRTWSASDQVVLGTTEPTVQGTFGVNVVYKQWSLYSTFMYEAGGQRYNQTLVDKVENVNVYADNVDRRVLSDRWQKPGDQAIYKSLVSGRSAVDITKPTERFVQNYNMLSWNSLELGYDLAASLTEKLHLSMVRLTLGMNDLLHLSSVKQERGISYPFARTVTFSVKISL